jgi:transcriptional regulator with XRE-family HTH domain
VTGPDRRSAGDPAPLLRQFGTNLRACRQEAGSTPEELAAAAGMGVELLIELEEAGGTIPGIGLFLRLASLLGRRPSELVAGIDWTPYEVVQEQGVFEVLEDDGLLAEIVALKEARPKGPPADAA